MKKWRILAGSREFFVYAKTEAEALRRFELARPRIFRARTALGDVTLIERAP